VFAFVLGRRLGYPRHKILPHDLTMTLLGAGLLWFGWFGFNAGSALSSGGAAVLALINTHVAAGAGALAWATVEWVRYKKPSALGVASGLVAGLVAITPAAGYIGPLPALAIGLSAGVACYLGVLLKHRVGYDDALDAFGVHGVGGALGAILTGVFASTYWNPAGQDGLAFGGVSLFVENLLSVVVAGLYAAGVSFVLLKAIDRVMGLRPDPEAEHDGLDGALHGEEAYATAGIGMRPVPEDEPTPVAVKSLPSSAELASAE
jgi:Amt family ammonium transporter